MNRNIAEVRAFAGAICLASGAAAAPAITKAALTWAEANAKEACVADAKSRYGM